MPSYQSERRPQGNVMVKRITSGTTIEVGGTYCRLFKIQWSNGAAPTATTVSLRTTAAGAAGSIQGYFRTTATASDVGEVDFPGVTFHDGIFISAFPTGATDVIAFYESFGLNE